jgi:hypothetical protein
MGNSRLADAEDLGCPGQISCSGQGINGFDLGMDVSGLSIAPTSRLLTGFR